MKFRKQYLPEWAGFTLVEVLLAVALFMVLVISLVGAGQLSVKSSQVSIQRVGAVNLARDTMEAVLAVRASNFGGLREGSYFPEINAGQWRLVEGTQLVGDFQRRIEISRVQRELSCGGERVCPIVSTGGVVDPVTFRAKIFVTWQENRQNQELSLESLLTFWR